MGRPDPPGGERQPTFFLGTHMPLWLTISQVPLFISANRLRAYRSTGDEWPTRKADTFGCGMWALDSGGFTELRDHGRWRDHPDVYGGMVTRFIEEIGAPPRFVSPQDWMCEPWVIAGGGASGAAVRWHRADGTRPHRAHRGELLLPARGVLLPALDTRAARVAPGRLRGMRPDVRLMRGRPHRIARGSGQCMPAAIHGRDRSDRGNVLAAWASATRVRREDRRARPVRAHAQVGRQHGLVQAGQVGRRTAARVRASWAVQQLLPVRHGVAGAGPQVA